MTYKHKIHNNIIKYKQYNNDSMPCWKYTYHICIFTTIKRLSIWNDPQKPCPNVLVFQYPAGCVVGQPYWQWVVYTRDIVQITGRSGDTLREPMTFASEKLRPDYKFWIMNLLKFQCVYNRYKKISFKILQSRIFTQKFCNAMQAHSVTIGSII